jgi:hypothetical protein
VSHYDPYQLQARGEIDSRIMATLFEFYNIMMGLVNFRFYSSLLYPLQFNVSLVSEQSQIDESMFVSVRMNEDLQPAVDLQNEADA